MVAEHGENVTREEFANVTGYTNHHHLAKALPGGWPGCSSPRRPSSTPNWLQSLACSGCWPGCMGPTSAVVLIAAIAALIPLAWWIALGLCARLGGWTRLIRCFGTSVASSADTTWTGVSITLRAGAFLPTVHYDHCARLDASWRGLHLSIGSQLLNRLHPPVVLPWREMRVTVVRRWRHQHCVVIVPRARVRIILPAAIGDAVLRQWTARRGPIRG